MAPLPRADCVCRHVGSHASRGECHSMGAMGGKEEGECTNLHSASQWEWRGVMAEFVEQSQHTLQ